MKSATMVYKCPGPHVLHGIGVDYKIVDAVPSDGACESELDEALKAGWFRTPIEASEGVSNEKPQQEEKPFSEWTRDELKAKAVELGLKINKTWKDSTIVSKIEDILNRSG